MQLVSPIDADYTVYTAYVELQGLYDSTHITYLSEQLECRLQYYALYNLPIIYIFLGMSRLEQIQLMFHTQLVFMMFLVQGMYPV